MNVTGKLSHVQSVEVHISLGPVLPTKRDLGCLVHLLLHME